MKKFMLLLILLSFISCAQKVQIPEVIKGRPSDNIMEFGESYWMSLGFEEKRTFLEGYMLGLYSATLQVAFFENIPHDKLKHVAMLNITAEYLLMRLDVEYRKKEKREDPIFRVLYQINKSVQKEQ